VYTSLDELKQDWDRLKQGVGEDLEIYEQLERTK
jgi:hypothetical protein